MENQIIFCFNFYNNPSFNNIVNYCNRFKEIENSLIKKKLKQLINNNYIISNTNNNYLLEDDGKYVLKNLKNYYKNIIYIFYKKYINIKNKKFYLKEKRLEQDILRKYLISSCSNICYFCDKKFPIFLLETAHIKPRCILNFKEKNNYNNVIFLCKICHAIFDKGFLSVNDNKLLISDKFNISDYDLPSYKKNIIIKKKQKDFFDYHYKNIYKKKN